LANFGVTDKIPAGSNLLFEDAQIPLQCRISVGSLCAKNELNQCMSLPACDREVDRQTEP